MLLGEIERPQHRNSTKQQRILHGRVGQKNSWLKPEFLIQKQWEIMGEDQNNSGGVIRE